MSWSSSAGVLGAGMSGGLECDGTDGRADRAGRGRLAAAGDRGSDPRRLTEFRTLQRRCKKGRYPRYPTGSAPATMAMVFIIRARLDLDTMAAVEWRAWVSTSRCGVYWLGISSGVGGGTSVSHGLSSATTRAGV